MIVESPLPARTNEFSLYKMASVAKEEDLMVLRIKTDYYMPFVRKLNVCA